jgi:DNA polymerase-3 subunit gamma/tau
MAFAGRSVSTDDVATVLGLVGRDLLFDAVQAVADDNAAAAFELTGRAVEMGYDLRSVCRELSRVVRDLLVVSIDPGRLSDPEIAGETERERVKQLAARFSREDLLRAFDLLTKAEAEIRTAAQPRYNLEMALLRWIYVRKLVPLEDLIAAVSGSERPGGGSKSAAPTRTSSPPTPSRPSRTAPSLPDSSRVGSGSSGVESDLSGVGSGFSRNANAPDLGSGFSRTDDSPEPSSSRSAPAAVKDALLAEIKKSKAVFYNMVVAQAQSVQVDGDRVTFTFSSAQRALRDSVEQHRGWLEGIAGRLAGRKLSVAVVQDETAASATVASDRSAKTGGGARPEAGANGGDARSGASPSALRDQALADAGIQALLEVFPAEIRDVEEM